MKKKLFSSIIVFTLILSLTFGTTSKAYAMGGFGEIMLGTGAVIAVEEAIAWTLLACGLTAGADAVYRNQDELKNWANARLEDIKDFGSKSLEFGSEVVAGLGDWFSNLANGIMDTGSKCWDMIKGWAGSVYEGIQTPSLDSPYYGSGSFADNFDFVSNNGSRWKGVASYTGSSALYTGVYIGWDGSCYRNVYSLEPFTVSMQYTINGKNPSTSFYESAQTTKVYDGVRYTYHFYNTSITTQVPYGLQTHDDFLEALKNNIYGDANVGDYTTVGGLNDAFDKGGMSMDDYDVSTKTGVVGGVINLDWQQLMDRDKINVDSNTGVATGTIAGSLSNVATGAMSWTDSLDKVGVVPIVGSNVIDDAGVTDKPRPQKPNNPDMDGNYIFDLRHIFPFCLPFDLVDFLACLSAPPQTPKFTIEIPSFNSDMSVKWHKLELDFSQFNQVAVWVRNMELFAFIVGLAMITRSKIIRG